MITNYVQISDLVGQTFLSVKNHDNELIFVGPDCSYKLYHEADCCESVTIEDIIGDLNDLVGTPILEAEEVVRSKGESLDDLPVPELAEDIKTAQVLRVLDQEEDPSDESYTWTFYKFATIKGRVTIRWYGSSNGYYSESVSFCKT